MWNRSPSAGCGYSLQQLDDKVTRTKSGLKQQNLFLLPRKVELAAGVKAQKNQSSVWGIKWLKPGGRVVMKLEWIFFLGGGQGVAVGWTGFIWPCLWRDSQWRFLVVNDMIRLSIPWIWSLHPHCAFKLSLSFPKALASLSFVVLEILGWGGYYRMGNAEHVAMNFWNWKSQWALQQELWER